MTASLSLVTGCVSAQDASAVAARTHPSYSAAFTSSPGRTLKVAGIHSSLVGVLNGPERSCSHRRDGYRFDRGHGNLITQHPTCATRVRTPRHPLVVRRVHARARLVSGRSLPRTTAQHVAIRRAAADPRRPGSLRGESLPDGVLHLSASRRPHPWSFRG